jgi:hypothetical protein
MPGGSMGRGARALIFDSISIGPSFPARIFLADFAPNPLPEKLG